MNLRDEIADIVWGSSNMDRFDAEEYTAAILAKVREALLSNDVQAPIRQELHNYPRTSTRDTVKTVIDMALGALTADYSHHS